MSTREYDLAPYETEGMNLRGARIALVASLALWSAGIGCAVLIKENIFDHSSQPAQEQQQLSANHQPVK